MSAHDEENLASMEAKSETENTLIDSDANCASQIVTPSLEKDNIWTKWPTIIDDWNNIIKNENSCIPELVRRGIPRPFRPVVWQLLCGASDNNKKKYANYLKVNSPREKLIRRDMERTYSEYEFFKQQDEFGKEALYNVIKAYSIYDPEIGCWEGLACIVGLLLIKVPAEDAFAILVQIMQQYKLRDMFITSKLGLSLRIYQLENLVQDLIPELNNHFQINELQTSAYASRWFLTLFICDMHISVSYRVMDIFLSEGINFIFKAALALLTFGKEDLFLCLDKEAMLHYFQKPLIEKVVRDTESFLRIANEIKIDSEKLEKYKNDYFAPEKNIEVSAIEEESHTDENQPHVHTDENQPHFMENENVEILRRLETVIAEIRILKIKVEELSQLVADLKQQQNSRVETKTSEVPAENEYKFMFMFICLCLFLFCVHFFFII